MDVAPIPTTTELIETGEKRDLLGRKLTPGERRAELLAAFKASGLTQAEFVRREGLRYSTFCTWGKSEGRVEKGAYDTLGRLTSISAVNPLGSGPMTLDSFAYTYDAAGQRSTETTPTYSQNFTYDPQRELTQATPANPTTQRPAYTYAYDGIGNRQSSSSALSSSVALAQAGYTANSVNQYTAITQTVNSQSTTVNPSYDLNGNTTSTQGLTLTYDNENRLIGATDNATTQEVYIYDGMGRRVETQVSSWDLSLGTWSLVSDTLFVYDGQRVVEEWSAPLASSLLPPSLLRSYTRGLDLSGSLEGAGGIGGLLAMANYAPGSSTPVSTASYFYDGNGNVIDLVGDDGSSQAHYQYSPFGETLVATGPLATVNPYQFSTKENDVFTGFYYYGQRYYHPGTGRWLSRDPSEENGGMNLYGFVGNDPINRIDPLGLYWTPGWLKSVARWEWTLVAEHYMRPRGLNISADLLEHSLQDNPSDLIPFQEAAQPMQNSPEMLAFYKSIPDGCYKDWTAIQIVELRQNRDLFFAFHHVHVQYKGCKCSNDSKLDFKVTNKYTFHRQQLETSDFMQFLGTLGANAAYLDQLGGTIEPFDLEVDFTMPPSN